MYYSEYILIINYNDSNLLITYVVQQRNFLENFYFMLFFMMFLKDNQKVIIHSLENVILWITAPFFKINQG